MMKPKMMCNAPKPRIMSGVFHEAGVNSASAPTMMKDAPITGTIRTEKAPAATTAVPYRSIHTPGRRLAIPRFTNAKVMTMPTRNAGVKLKSSLRAELVSSGRLASFALLYMNHTEISSARMASAAHTSTHSTGIASWDASTAARIAVIPMTTCPHPETAVNVPAASIVSRMKRRLSIARACISGGSLWRRIGSTSAMLDSTRPYHLRQVLYDVKRVPCLSCFLSLVRAQRRWRGGRRIARRKAEVGHLVHRPVVEPFRKRLHHGARELRWIHGRRRRHQGLVDLDAPL